MSRTINGGRGVFSTAIVDKNRQGVVAVIPDIKCVSPKEGDLMLGRDPRDLARRLVACGAPALSVVTESTNFGGSLELLSDITQSVSVPVLRKDFITSREMLEQTAAFGAAAVLLICSVLNAIGEKTLDVLFAAALELELEPLVEVHDLHEMKLAAQLGARLVGVNNRDILALETDDGGVSRTTELASTTPQGAILVSESGIMTPADAQTAVLAGANAILVGTALLQAFDLEAVYASLQVVRESDTCE